MQKMPLDLRMTKIFEPVLIAIFYILSHSVGNSFIATAYTLPIRLASKIPELNSWSSLRNDRDRYLTIVFAAGGGQRSFYDDVSPSPKKRKLRTMVTNILSKARSLHTSGNFLIKRRLENNLKSHLPPLVQLLVVLVCYMVHLYIFTQNSLVFPVCILLPVLVYNF
jgi:hypothetical protein